MADDKKEAGKPDKGTSKPDDEITLAVNGRSRSVTEKKQSYRDIAKLAYPDANFDQFLFTITYFKGEGGHEGDLVEGEKVNVKNGMVFNVRRSDRS